MKTVRALLLFTVGLLTAARALAPEPGTDCQVLKLRAAARYHECRLRTQARAIRHGETPDFTSCDARLDSLFSRIEAVGGEGCARTADVADIVEQVTRDTMRITSRLAGVRFVDNGDGTVTDTKTGLVWEQKDGDDGEPDSRNLHDVDNRYTWAEGMGEWISLVNGVSGHGVGQSGLGGYSDWRLPTRAELQTLLPEALPCDAAPCIDPVFGPTAAGYWSATTFTRTACAWLVAFTSGTSEAVEKATMHFLRAVRGDPFVAALEEP